MKILQVNTEKTWRGGERQTLYTLKGLMNEGVDCQLLALKDYPLHKNAEKLNIKVIAVSSWLETMIKLAVLDKEFSCIHAQAGKAHTQAILTKFLHGLPVIYTRRVNFKPNGQLTRVKYRLTDQVVSISNAISSILHEKRMFFDSLVISSVVEKKEPDHQRLNQFKEIFIKDKSLKVIGIVSALVGHKDPMTALSAIKELVKIRSDFIVLHFGKGILFDQVSKKIKALKLESCYLQMGHYDGVEDFYTIMDVFMMSSSEEGLGSSVLDAFQYEVPVVSTNAGGLKELVSGRGYLCEVGDAKALADGLDQALNQTMHSIEMKQVAKQYCDTEISIKSMVKQYIEIYKELSNGKSA
jgi:glycosyltransferase involved in cell wall biosynthesis